jgi:hypothetical protein
VLNLRLRVHYQQEITINPHTANRENKSIQIPWKKPEEATKAGVLQMLNMEI